MQKDALNKNKNKNIIFLAWEILLVFMLVYKNSPIASMTFITSERVAILLLFLTALLKKGFKLSLREDSICRKIWKKEVFFQGFLLVYTLIVVAFIGWGDGSTLTKEIIDFIIMAPITVYSLRIIIDSVDELMKVLLVITLFQSVVVLAGVVSPAIGSLIDALPMNQTHVYWTYDHYRSLGYPGGIACVAAKGSLQMSLGCIAAYYFICKKTREIRYWLYYAVIAIAMTAVARTGLVIALIVSFFIIKDRLGQKKVINTILLLGIVACILLSVSLVISDGTAVFFGKGTFFTRVRDLIERGFYNSFFRWYLFSPSTVIPPITIKTIVGTNILSGISGNGVMVNVDGGYLRMYVALGLPLALFFYYYQGSLMIKARRFVSEHVNKTVCLLFALLMLLGEFKEFYFYLRYLIIIYFVFCYQVEKEEARVGQVTKGT